MKGSKSVTVSNPGDFGVVHLGEHDFVINSLTAGYA